MAMYEIRYKEERVGFVNKSNQDAANQAAINMIHYLDRFANQIIDETKIIVSLCDNQDKYQHMMRKR